MSNTATKTANAPPTTRRMSLANVVKGVLKVPDRILLYGIEGIGKSSFAAKAPAPIFIEPEREGTARLDVQRFQSPDSWADIVDAVDVLTVEDHAYQTCVIDTLDAAEAMLWRHICARDKKGSIEEYGYGKGYVAALDEWRVFLAALERLRRVKGMGIILIAHSWIKPFKNPEGEDFDRYELKLNAKAGGLLKEWSDAVLFANYETFAVKNDRTGVVKGVSNGARVIHTHRTAAWDAKNRYGLPETLPLNYDDFAAGVTSGQPEDPARLVKHINETLAALADEVLSKKVMTTVEKAGGDATKLASIDNRLNALLADKQRKGE